LNKIHTFYGTPINVLSLKVRVKGISEDTRSAFKMFNSYHEEQSEVDGGGKLKWVAKL
jgi:hypothetical protein